MSDTEETTKETFECKDCHLHFYTQELATLCEESCAKGACSSEVTAQSIERMEASKEKSEEATSSETEEPEIVEEPVLTEGDYEGKWKRALADYQNLKKENGYERIRMRKHAIREVVESLLPILDNFTAATAQEPDTDDAKVKNWVMGVGFIKKQMTDMLGEFGIKPIETEGKAFDAKLMEAVGEEESDGESGTVLRETTPGYVMGETIIRPAKVITVK